MEEPMTKMSFDCNLCAKQMPEARKLWVDDDHRELFPLSTIENRYIL